MTFAGRRKPPAILDTAAIAAILREHGVDPDLAATLHKHGVIRRVPRPHAIGKVAILYHKIDREWWVLVDGHVVARSISPRAALRRARTKFPKPPQRRRSGLIGVRYWRLIITEEGPKLSSVAYPDHHWNGPHAKAHEPPALHNCSGIYCFKVGAEEGWDGAENGVRGLLEIYGKIVRATRGYRAEHAIIRALEVLPRATWPPLVAALEQRYQCPVRVWK